MKSFEDARKQAFEQYMDTHFFFADPDDLSLVFCEGWNEGAAWLAKQAPEFDEIRADDKIIQDSDSLPKPLERQFFIDGARWQFEQDRLTIAALKAQADAQRALAEAQMFISNKLQEENETLISSKHGPDEFDDDDVICDSNKKEWVSMPAVKAAIIARDVEIAVLKRNRDYLKETLEAEIESLRGEIEIIGDSAASEMKRMNDKVEEYKAENSQLKIKLNDLAPFDAHYANWEVERGQMVAEIERSLWEKARVDTENENLRELVEALMYDNRGVNFEAARKVLEGK